MYQICYTSNEKCIWESLLGHAVSVNMVQSNAAQDLYTNWLTTKTSLRHYATEGVLGCLQYI